jgi:hypothetical protein
MKSPGSRGHVQLLGCVLSFTFPCSWWLICRCDGEPYFTIENAKEYWNKKLEEIWILRNLKNLRTALQALDCLVPDYNMGKKSTSMLLKIMLI